MRVVTPCPNESTLDQFARGELPDEELEGVGVHLDDCLKCRNRLDAVPDPPIAPDNAVPNDSGLRRATELVLLVSPPGNDYGHWPAPPEPPPERLDRFRILGRLGAGAMGVVYEAEDEALGRRVAVKVLRAEFAVRTGARERFLREARAMATLRHPNVVAIHHVGDDEANPFLVMELLEGEMLGTRLRRDGSLPPAEVVRIGMDVAAGLAVVHQAGLVHRDVTPDNIWLIPDGTAKVLDFGLVRAEGDGAVTHPGTIIGTPRYMAPEQARAQAVDSRADVFGLGAVLYHAATGQCPFPGEDALATLAALASFDPLPADRLNPAVPTQLARAISRMMAKDPADRPESAESVSGLLKDSLVRPRRPWIRLGLAVTLLVGIAGVLIARGSTSEMPAAAIPGPETIVEPELPPPEYGLEFAPGTSVEIAGLDLNAYDDVTIEFHLRPNEFAPMSSVHLVGTARQASFFSDAGGRLWGFGYRTSDTFRGLKFPCPPRDQWVHVAAVKEALRGGYQHNMMRVFVGGRPMNDLLAPSGRFDATANLFTFGPGLNAGIDEVRISSIARYKSEFTPSLRFEPDANTIALYHCDEPDSPTLTDSSSHGRHGKFRGDTGTTRSTPRR